MNYLVLGSSGYLGSKLIKKLVEKGEHVVGTARKGSDLSRLNNQREQIRIIDANISSIETAMQYESFDWVINASGSYGRSSTLYKDVLQSNIDFPLYILNLAVEKGIENYMTIDTGLPDRFNMYSFSKHIFSQFGEFYAQKHDISFINLCLQMFYGFDESRDRFIPDSIYKMLHGIDVDTTEGTQLRDIIAIEDVVDAIDHILGCDLKGFHDIDIGTGVAPSIREILEFIHNEIDSSSKINYGAREMRKGEPSCVADISKLESLGYSLRYDWRSGIKKMIGEMRDYENID